MNIVETAIPRTRSGEVPLIELLHVPEALTVAFHADWRERHGRELDSAHRFRALARALADTDSDLSSRLAAAAYDEERHAAVCVEVLARAGLPPPKVIEPKERREDPLRAVVAALCIGETLAVGPLESAMEKAHHPFIRESLAVLMKGEIRHARVGWAWAAESGTVALAQMEAELPALATRVITELLEEPEPPPLGPQWGLLTRQQRALALRTTLCGTLMPALAARGLPYEKVRDAGLSVLTPFL